MQFSHSEVDYNTSVNIVMYTMTSSTWPLQTHEASDLNTHKHIHVHDVWDNASKIGLVGL